MLGSLQQIMHLPATEEGAMHIKNQKWLHRVLYGSRGHNEETIV